MAKICKTPEMFFHGFPVMINGIYGRNKQHLFVCNNYDGIKTGHLIIFVNNHNYWHKTTVDKNSWQFKEIAKLILEIGKIPVPKYMKKKPTYKIVGQPYARRVSYDYTPTGTSVGSLIRQSYDNADYGGFAVSNPESYWSGYVKNERRCVKNPLIEK